MVSGTMTNVEKEAGPRRASTTRNEGRREARPRGRVFFFEVQRLAATAALKTVVGNPSIKTQDSKSQLPKRTYRVYSIVRVLSVVERLRVRWHAQTCCWGGEYRRAQQSQDCPQIWPYFCVCHGCARRHGSQPAEEVRVHSSTVPARPAHKKAAYKKVRLRFFKN